MKNSTENRSIKAPKVFVSYAQSEERTAWVKDICERLLHDGVDYFLIPNTPSFAALATRNLTTVLAGILIFCCVFGLKPVRAFPFLLHQLAETGQNKFTILFDLFVGKRAKRIEEYSSGVFIGLGGFGKCTLESVLVIL
jgi:hypothetical protein